MCVVSIHQLHEIDVKDNVESFELQKTFYCAQSSIEGKRALHQFGTTFCGSVRGSGTSKVAEFEHCCVCFVCPFNKEQSQTQLVTQKT